MHSTAEKLNIRAATAADIEALVALRFAFLEEFRHIGGDTKTRLDPEIRGYFTRHLGKPDFVALLGEVDGQPAGTVFLTICEGPPNDQYPNGLIGYVFNMYTQPALRGRGYAKTLMGYLIADARRLGVTAINLNASSAGRPLYETLGFNVLNDTAMRMMLS